MGENEPAPGEEPVPDKEPVPGQKSVPGGDRAPGMSLEPERLLGELASLRRRTRSARHAYWLPLVLYGVLICAAAPLYVQNDDPHASGVYSPPGPQIQIAGLGGAADGYIAVYWLFALVAGFWLTALWYRQRGRRAGLRTSARVFIVVGVVVTAALILFSVVPPAARLWPGDLVLRGTVPLFVIAAGLFALAWAERSWALIATALIFTGAALLSSLYNVENILFRLGWSPGPGQLGLTALPGALLPAVVLLVAGLCAFPAQRPRRLAPR
jgi:hypothetical protein